MTDAQRLLSKERQPRNTFMWTNAAPYDLGVWQATAVSPLRVHSKYLASRVFRWDDFRRAYADAFAATRDGQAALALTHAAHNAWTLADFYRRFKELQLHHRGAGQQLTVSVEPTLWQQSACDVTLAAVHIQFDRMQLSEPTDCPLLVLQPPLAQSRNRTLLALVAPAPIRRNKSTTSKWTSSSFGVIQSGFSSG